MERDSGSREDKKGKNATERVASAPSAWPSCFCVNNGGLCAKRVSKLVCPQPRGSAIVPRLPPQAPGGELYNTQCTRFAKHNAAMHKHGELKRNASRPI